MKMLHRWFGWTSGLPGSSLYILAIGFLFHQFKAYLIKIGALEAQLAFTSFRLLKVLWINFRRRRIDNPATSFKFLLNPFQSYLLKIVAKTFLRWSTFIWAQSTVWLSNAAQLEIAFWMIDTFVSSGSYSLKCRNASKRNSVQKSITFKKTICCPSGTFTTASHLENKTAGTVDLLGSTFWT